MRAARGLGLIVLVLAAGCGPKLREVSIAITVASVAIVVLANALLWPLWRLWRTLRPQLELEWKPFVVVGAVLSSVGLFAAQLPHEGSVPDLLLTALWAVGSSYLTLLLLVWRLRVPAPHAQTIAHAVASALMLLPAVVLAFVASPEEPLSDVLLSWWVIPGYAGIVTGVVLAGLLVEVAVRRKMAGLSTPA